MINFLKLKNSDNKDELLDAELQVLKGYITAQKNFKDSLTDCIDSNATSPKPVFEDELKNSLEQVKFNIKNLETLQKNLKKLQKTDPIDAVSVKAYNQLYLDVELNVNEATEEVEKLLKDYDDNRVNTVKTLDVIEQDSEKNITCFFPKSHSDIFAVSTIYKRFLLYVKENRTIRLSIDEEDFDISIKTPNVQISNDANTVLISRKSSGYEIVTNLNVELTNQFNIPKILKDHDFLKFNVNAFNFTLLVDNDMLSFAKPEDENSEFEAQPVQAAVAKKEESLNAEVLKPTEEIVPKTEPDIPQVLKTTSLSKEDYNKAIDAITANPTEIEEPKHVEEHNTVVVNTPDTSTELHDNNTLVISNENDKIVLPYKIADLEKMLKRNPKKYSSVEDIIAKEYTIAADQFKNPVRSRFKEAYKLIKKKEKGSLKEAIDLGIELMFQSNLNPAIITACKSLRELDIYLNCLDENELDKFNCFEIIYKVPPTKNK